MNRTSDYLYGCAVEDMEEERIQAQEIKRFCAKHCTRELGWSEAKREWCRRHTACKAWETGSDNRSK